MGLLHRHHDLGGSKYRMREKVFAIGDDFWVENEDGERQFKVNGKALRIRDTLVLEDASGAELFSIQEKKLHIHDTMKIERGGHTVATVKKALISPLRERFSIEVEGGEEMEAKGNVVDHEYKIEKGRRQGGRGLEALVPRPGHVRHRGRARPGRRAPSRRRRLHRPDGARLRRPAAAAGTPGRQMSVASSSLARVSVASVERTLAHPSVLKAGGYLAGVNSGTITACPRDVMLCRSSFTGW